MLRPIPFRATVLIVSHYIHLGIPERFGTMMDDLTLNGDGKASH
jgi:hypothetical protein